MRRDDDMATVCGVWGAGIIISVSLALMLLAAGIIGFWTTGEQGYK